MDRAELDRLTGQQAELVAVRARIAAASSVLDGIRVDEAAVTKLENARERVVEARAALAAGAPEVEVRRLGGEVVELSGTGLDAGTGTVPDKLDDGGQARLLVSGELVVGIPGQLEVTVRAGGGAATLRSRLDDAVRKEKDLLGRAGVRDLAEARELLRKADTATAELQEARRTERSLTSAGDPGERVALLSARLGVELGRPSRRKRRPVRIACRRSRACPASCPSSLSSTRRSSMPRSPGREPRTPVPRDSRRTARAVRPS
jgi:hypothetical protein